ncbi:MAG: hypothetical protein KatS3mg008_1965 [Acidimicrobiales bacterium]|nr:MAG: hypothetical protein KatS3mg008_1965 [Acidimicrobiales bacterium]
MSGGTSAGMTTVEAPGLPADWFNGWLAAIGVTVMAEGVKLSWSEDPVPHALFHVPEGLRLEERLATRLSDREWIDSDPIARHLDGYPEFPRKVSLETYRARAKLEREQKTGTLAASVSDTNPDADPADLEHGPLDVPMPRGETLWERAKRCQESLSRFPDLVGRVRQTLLGEAERLPLAGLGFDAKRTPSGVLEASSPHVDPVVELMCFAALRLFPAHTGARGRGGVLGRGWTGSSRRQGSFIYVTWRIPLDCWGIDAFLDVVWSTRERLTRRFGRFLSPVKFEVVPYKTSGSSDVTSAFFTRARAEGS